MSKRVAVVGLGYVGLPLAIEMQINGIEVIGYDVNGEKIASLIALSNLSIANEEELKRAFELGLVLTNSSDIIENCNIFIVAVPTPVDSFHIPDLSFLKNASFLVGKYLKNGDIVIYESTVYPGCTEEICIPILENASGLRIGADFGVGYSPERINPGDNKHRLDNVKKIISASDDYTLSILKNIYGKVVKAGLYCTSTIKVAEAAKITENTQRDINISLMNELAVIFERMEIDTNEVIDAAATKWNFIPFRPGLVGGHCISVDPYYLVYKAQQLGYSPEVILSGRRVNNYIPIFIASKVAKLLSQKNIPLHGAHVLILGFTFKENCSDARNSKVVEIYHELVSFGALVDIVDPWANIEEVKREYKICLYSNLDQSSQKYDAFVLAVAHDTFRNVKLLDYSNNLNPIIVDTRNFYDKEFVTYRL